MGCCPDSQKITRIIWSELEFRKFSLVKQPLISPLIFGKVCEPDLCGSFRTTPTAGWGVLGVDECYAVRVETKTLTKNGVFDGFFE